MQVRVQLTEAEDVGSYIEGRFEGLSLAIKKRTVEAWSFDGDTVVIQLPAASWRRRLYKARKQPEPDPVPVTKIRKCLCCENSFHAERFTFVCSPCKNSTAWRMSGSFFLN